VKKVIGVLLLAGVIGSVCAQAFPPGNYVQSCGNIFWLTPTSLLAICQMEFGQYQTNQSILENANLCSYIENINGVLTCTGGFK
jgi:hypothetical protein